jgi:hypothetical protein
LGKNASLIVLTHRGLMKGRAVCKMAWYFTEFTFSGHRLKINCPCPLIAAQTIKPFGFTVDSPV